MRGPPFASRSRWTLRSALPLLAAVLFAARSIAACGEDDAPPGAPPLDGGGTGESGPSVPDPNRDADLSSSETSVALLPSFCQGIVLYLSFDVGANADLGGGRVRAVPDPSRQIALAAGRHGQAVELTNGPDAATGFLYDRALAPSDAGNATDGGDAGLPIIYPEQEGTLAYWYRRTAPAAALECHVRPLPEPVGPVVARDNARFGLWRNLGGLSVLTFPVEALAPFMRGTDFDHIAVSWRRENPDAGVSTFAQLAINGGIGAVVADGGFDAAAANPSPDDAGNLPYRAQTDAGSMSFTLNSLRVGGIQGTSPQGRIDDFAVWNRVLSLQEIAELYAAAGSLGAICAL